MISAVADARTMGETPPASSSVPSRWMTPARDGVIVSGSSTAPGLDDEVNHPNVARLATGRRDWWRTVTEAREVFLVVQSGSAS